MGDFDPLVGPPAQELGSIPPPPPPDPADDPAAQPPAAEPVPLVDEGIVRSVMIGVGNMVCMVDGATPDIWRFTPDELDQLVPPLTRLANRNDPLRRALLSGDYVLIALHLSGYMARNVRDRKEATNGQSRQAPNAHGPGPGGAAQLVGAGSQPAPGANGGRPANAPAVAQ